MSTRYALNGGEATWRTTIAELAEFEERSRPVRFDWKRFGIGNCLSCGQAHFLMDELCWDCRHVAILAGSVKP